ncbi:MAG: trypsin-like peptidase domain-containing protein [Candidatus Saccharimonadales bacterium]
MKRIKKIITMPRVSSKVLIAVLFVALSMLSGLGGAWLFDRFLDDNPLGSGSTTENRARVIAEGEVVADIAKQVSPSVVSIVVESQQASFFGPVEQQGAGTGIIISKDGYILTNKHVIGENASNVSVVTTDGTMYDNVRVVGRDPVNDIAFLKIQNVDNLTPAVLGDSSNLVVGSKVVAIGNALGEFQTTVTSGIVSGVNRSVVAGDEVSSEQLSNLIQTDAAINPGNSGGPLLNVTGEVIGINTAVSQGAEGIGFAIPINEAKGLIRGILANGRIERAYLGVRYVMLSEEAAKYYELKETSGAYVTGSESGAAIASGSPAEKAGIKDGDIITKVNGTKLGKDVTLVSQLSPFAPGESVKLTIVRDGREQVLTVVLGEYQS